MTKTFYLNVIVILIISLSFSLYISTVDYYKLIDPYHYLKEITRSYSVEDALFYGSNWSNDLGFIAISYALEKLFDNGNDIGFTISLLIFAIVTYSFKSRMNDNSFLTFYLMVMLGFSFLGMIFNVWRQGFAIAFIMMSISNERTNTRYILIACFFHLSTSLLFLIFDLILKSTKSKLIMVLWLIILPILAYILFTTFQSSIDVYSSDSLNESTTRLRYIFSLVMFSSCVAIAINERISVSEIVEINSVKFVGFIIIIGFILLISLPSASDRFMHYFFCIYPLMASDIYLKLKTVNMRRFLLLKSILFTIIVFYFSVSSSTFSLLKESIIT